MRSTRSGNVVNGAFNYSQRGNKDVPDDQDSLTAFLKSRGKEGFATSAYWGATGEVPPRAPDDEVMEEPYPFQAEINRKLVPFPKDQTSYPRTIDYTTVGFHLSKSNNANSNNTGGLNASQLQKLQGTGGDDLDGTRQLTGGAQSRKPRFLTLQTTAQTIPRAFDDEVLDTLRAGQEKEDALKAELDELEGSPYGSTEVPDPYRLTSDDYCNFSEVNPSSYRQKDVADPEGGSVVYKSRYNNVEHEGPRRRERTHETLRRGQAVDHNQLRLTLDASHALSMPNGYSPYSAKDWLSTTHREHASYDVAEAARANDRDATEPLRNRHYTLSAAHEASVKQRDARFQTRHEGGWDTTYSTQYQDRSAEADVSRQHGARGIFDIKDGVYTMDKRYHKPRSDVHTGEIYTAAEMVPGQYTTMYEEPLQAPNAVTGRMQRV